MKRLLPHALLALFVLVLGGGSAGCGSSSDTTTATVTKAAYIKQGDRICRDNYTKRTNLLTQLHKKFETLPSQAKQEDILVNQIMPIFQEESKELNALQLPEEGADEAEAILKALEKSIDGVEADPAKSLTEGTEVEFSEAEQMARQYGFEWCGRS